MIKISSNTINILVACEFSGVVRSALNSMHGIHAVSCDLLPPEDGMVDYHYQGDVKDIIMLGWNGLIAHPPCTDLAVSGARYFKQKRANGHQQKAIDFFMMLMEGAIIEKIATENPVGIMSTIYRKPDQIIQPWQFGHPESKTTCLWLKGLPPLIPTKILTIPENGRWENQTPSHQNKLGPGPDRWKNRSRTYSGIAMAMANQWGPVFLNQVSSIPSRK